MRHLIGWLAPAGAMSPFSAERVAVGWQSRQRPRPRCSCSGGRRKPGFTFTATMSQVDITVRPRVRWPVCPTHAIVNLSLKEEPPILPMTNPTSGGRAGGATPHDARRRDVDGRSRRMACGTRARGGRSPRSTASTTRRSVKPADDVYLPAADELASRTGGGAAMTRQIDRSRDRHRPPRPSRCWDSAQPDGGRQFLIRTVVDTSLHRPDMFELTFLDRTAPC